MLITLLKIMFWLCFTALLHTYVLYPILMAFLAKGKKLNETVYDRQNLPRIAVVIAAFNEAGVLAEKLQSILDSNYPKAQLDVFIGSDSSSDQTAQIAEEFASAHGNFNFVDFQERSGKAGVLNKLFNKYINKENYEAIILTDANVMFAPDCLAQLAQHFKNKTVGVVAANIVNKKVDAKRVGLQEKMYISNENRLKYHEGLAFGTSIGAFGACYAIRPNLITEIPANFLMEDFFLSMRAFLFHLKSIKDTKAIAYEDIPSTMQQEFKRKRRISSGNYQNLSVYYPLLFLCTKVAFAFFSHKILRWMGPFFLAYGYIFLLILALVDAAAQPYRTLFVIANFTVILALIDGILKRFDIHVTLFRLSRYFFLMNLALFLGLYDYINGVKTNIWKPTQRN